MNFSQIKYNFLNNFIEYEEKMTTIIIIYKKKERYNLLKCSNCIPSFATQNSVLQLIIIRSNYKLSDSIV